MASIAFSGVFLAPASDLSNTIYLDSFPSVSGGKQIPGAIKRYAGGRTRLVTQSGQSQTSNLTFEHISRANREALEALLGVLVLYRDGRGRRFTGVFLDFNAQEERGSSELCSVSFSLTEITHSLAV